ncbi:MAG: hypothetical protein H6625_13150 [Bdellovibrionaceae bacterium]|nr:hypothetical protein [Pseudobdellovibrionaceae bacterium]
MSRNIIVITFIGILIGTSSCSKKEGEFLTIPLDAGDVVAPVYATNYYVVIASGDTNHYGVSLYNESGQFVNLLKHFRDPSELGAPRGLIQFGNDNLLIALDNTDRIENFNLNTFSNAPFFSGGTLAGNIYDIETDSNNNILVIESNAIERFDSTAAQTTPIYISTTVGSCTLNGPRQMVVNNNNELLVTSYTNGRILHYDISTNTSSCITTTNVAANPYGILVHSNGSVYYNTWSDDQIWRANADGSGGVVVFATNLTILNNPGAMVELPDGTILVASTGTDTIEQFDENGNYIGTFIRDTQSLNVSDIAILSRQELVE